MEIANTRKQKIVENLKVVKTFAEKFQNIPETDLCAMTNVFDKEVEIGSLFTVAMSQYTETPDIHHCYLSEDGFKVEGYETILPECPLAKAVIGRHETFTTEYTVAGIDTRVKILKIEGRINR